METETSVAIEIGAYTGHFKRSKKKDVLSVARDELIHMVVLKRILAKHNDSPKKPKGILTIKSDIPESQIKAIKEQWNKQVNGGPK